MSTSRVNTKSGAAALLLVLLGSGCSLQTASAGTVEMGGHLPLASRKLLQSSSNVPNSASPVSNNQYTGYYNRGEGFTGSPTVSFALGISLIALVCLFTLICCKAVQRRRSLRRMERLRREGRVRPVQANGVWRQNSGLAPGLVTTFPTKEYKRDSNDESADSEKECAVCLSEYEDGDLLRQLPGCSHSFHSACIDTWLDKHGTCPICRVRQIPNPPNPEGNPNGSSRQMQVLESTAELPGEGTGEEPTPREGAQSVHRVFFDALEHYRAELARVEAEAAGHLAAARPSEGLGVSAVSPQVAETSGQGARYMSANGGGSAGDVMVEIPLAEVGGSRLEGQSSLVNPVGSTTREEKGPGGVEIERSKQ